MTPRNVKSMTNMVKTHSRKEWEVAVEAMTLLTSSNLSSVAVLLEVRNSVNACLCLYCAFSPKPATGKDKKKTKTKWKKNLLRN